MSASSFAQLSCPRLVWIEWFCSWQNWRQIQFCGPYLNAHTFLQIRVCLSKHWSQVALLICLAVHFSRVDWLLSPQDWRRNGIGPHFRICTKLYIRSVFKYFGLMFRFCSLIFPVFIKITQLIACRISIRWTVFISPSGWFRTNGTHAREHGSRTGLPQPNPVRQQRPVLLKMVLKSSSLKWLIAISPGGTPKNGMACSHLVDQLGYAITSGARGARVF